jgi:hypothetical protein
MEAKGDQPNAPHQRASYQPRPAVRSTIDELQSGQKRALAVNSCPLSQLSVDAGRRW